MVKKNVVAPDVTPCSTPGCGGRGSTVVDGRAVCSACARESAKQASSREQDLANLGANPALVDRHGR